jgi:1-acyl-sn-glycerol-3-phosphate acyltransferase
VALHIVHGAGIVRWQFPRLDRKQRRSRIQAWAQGTVERLGLGLQMHGQPQTGAQLVVANHVSWLDIVVLHAVCPQTRFVSKREVAQWPLIGPLLRGAETLLLDRARPRDAARTVDHMVSALRSGDMVAVFPEGTTSDGRDVLPFRASLLQSGVMAQVSLQPVVLRYREADEDISSSVPYIGTTSFGQSLWRVCRARNVTVELRWLPPRCPPHTDRRALAQALWQDIRQHVVVERG